MKIRLGVVMDDIATIHYAKDSTLAMLFEASARDYEIYYFECQDLILREGQAYGKAQPLTVMQDSQHWYQLAAATLMPLAKLDMMLMRKDPPFNQTYLYATYILEQAKRSGVLVVNDPQALRDANEKLFTAYFPQCCPPTLVTMLPAALHEFWREHQDIVCKPLNTMGGEGVFRLQPNDPNANVIFNTLTQAGQVYIMAQQFIPAITKGDKRILLINGEPVPQVLARIPQANDWRGNLAVGAKGEVMALSEREQWICSQLAPECRARGLYFVGIDVIGDYLTEINVTSPTGIREIDREAGINISALLFDQLEKLRRAH